MKNISCKVSKDAESCQDLDLILLAPSATEARGYVPSNKKLITMERFHVLQPKKWADRFLQKILNHSNL